MTGDSFRAFGKRVKGLAKVPNAVAAAVAVDVEELVRQQFQKGEDAHGRPYDRLAATSLERGRGPSPLAAFADLVRAVPVGKAKVVIVVEHPKAFFHQKGTGRMPVRQLLPADLPDSWHRAIDRAFRLAVRRQITGAA